MNKQKINIVQKNYPLKNYNTFGFNISADFFFAFNNIDSFLDITESKIYKSQPVLILGFGSNILFTKNFEGFVIHPILKGIEIIDETEEFVFVKVFCGEIWDDFVAYTVSKGYGGIENLSGIPGSVGACPIQNIGAYGIEVKETITQVETLDISNLHRIVFKNSDCAFGYRDSIFKNEKRGRYLILNVTFKLTKKHSYNTCYGDIEKELHFMGDINLQNIRQAVLNIRTKKLPDPAILGNAGSFFKNPVVTQNTVNSLKQIYPEIPLFKLSDETYKIPAAWLIDQCGWKGKRAGNVGVHDRQALVLVNFGNGTGLEILNLANEIIHSVREKFQISISPEVNIF